jgi:hypothetical protein
MKSRSNEKKAVIALGAILLGVLILAASVTA